MSVSANVTTFCDHCQVRIEAFELHRCEKNAAPRKAAK